MVIPVENKVPKRAIHWKKEYKNVTKKLAKNIYNRNNNNNNSQKALKNYFFSKKKEIKTILSIGENSVHFSP